MRAAKEKREADTWRLSQTETKHLHAIQQKKKCWLGRLGGEFMTRSRIKKAADQARWVLPNRWSTLITHCLEERHLS